MDTKLWRSCTQCHGMGFYDTERNQGLGETCFMCNGLGSVNLGEICACGYPGVVWDNSKTILYCGRTSCLEALKRRAKQPAPMKSYPVQDFIGL